MGMIKEQTIAQGTKDGKKILSVTYPDIGLVKIGDTISARYFSRLKVNIEGKKSKVDYSFYWSYCPFCGEKVETQSSEKN